MERDDWLCQPCKARGILEQASEVDHIIPHSQGGDDRLANLQAICRACHKRKTAQEGVRGRTLDDR